ncbi:MAG TPA: hypothetical protein DCS13_03745 [Candidatus Margulisbacteria bacterium]|nr:MAG: hypothetical protein A2X43_03835 [Candidatus Margulisbacteria bacterium GWD2_39_127]HAR62556.1 hypothetical protein [Candidatus Margulisiibacteriota bacterium]
MINRMMDYLKKYKLVASIIVGIGVLLIPICVFAEEIQVDPDAPFYYNPSNGYFGIDNASPFAKLTLRLVPTAKPKYSSMWDYGGNGAFLIDGSNSNLNEGVMALGTIFSGVTGIPTGIAFHRYGSTWGTDIRFYAHPDDTSTYDGFNEVMRMQGNGKVGIGNVNPQYTLDVSGDMKVSSGLNVNGNLGVGSTSPAAKLTVKLVSSGKPKYSSIADYGGNGTLLIDASGSNINEGVMALGTIFSGGTGIPTGIAFHRYGNTWGTDIRFYTHSDDAVTVASFNEVMRIKGNGKVGIGLTDPQYTLTVSGNVAARNFITSQAVWADYVFGKSYALMSLDKLESYIQEHKHLPDVPSETEVLKNGVNISDMQKTLLQKVEELTLYVIKQGKEINSLKKDNVELNKKNEKFESNIGALQQEINELKKK